MGSEGSLGGRGRDLVKRFSILSLGIMVLIGVILTLGTSFIIEDFMIERAKVATVHLIRVQAANHLTYKDFIGHDFSSKKSVFERYFSEISIPEIVRIKVYSPDGVIVYSNEEKLIGQSFKGNLELEEALKGEVEIEIDRELKRKEEHLYEQGFRGLMEIYVPIMGEDGRVNGVVEVYQVLDPLDKAINQAQFVLGSLIIVSLGVLYFTLFGIVRGAAQTIERSEETLRKSEERFRAIHEGAAIGIALINKEGRILESNPALQKMIGYTAEELRSMSLADFTHPDDVVHYRSIFEELMRGKHNHYQMEKRYIRKDGSLLWGRLTISLVRDERQFVIGMIEDITERKKAEMELKLAYEELKVLDKMKDEFISNVSHELRTPLAIAKAAVDLLIDDADPEQKDLLNRARKSLFRLNALIGDLIEAVKAKAQKKVEVRKRGEMDVSELVKEAIRSLEALANEKDVRIESRVPKGLPRIKGERASLEHAVVHLLDNAIKFNKEGGRVIIDATVKDGQIELSIADTGIGIAEEQREKIFEKFYQIDGSTTRKYPGTGLGLALVKNAVERHGGRIRVESELGRGSKFIVTLPFKDLSGTSN
jgi:PAS domain S-box-containing protein